MRALLAKLKGPWLFVRYIEQFAKNHVRKNEGQLYSLIILANFLITLTSCQTDEMKKMSCQKCTHTEKETFCFAEKQYFAKKTQFTFISVYKQHCG